MQAGNQERKKERSVVIKRNSVKKEGTQKKQVRRKVIKKAESIGSLKIVAKDFFCVTKSEKEQQFNKRLKWSKFSKLKKLQKPCRYFQFGSICFLLKSIAYLEALSFKEETAFYFLSLK